MLYIKERITRLHCFYLCRGFFAGLPNLEHVVVIKYIEDNFTDISTIPHRWVALLYPIQSIIT